MTVNFSIPFIWQVHSRDGDWANRCFSMESSILKSVANKYINIKHHLLAHEQHIPCPEYWSGNGSELILLNDEAWHLPCSCSPQVETTKICLLGISPASSLLYSSQNEKKTNKQNTFYTQRQHEMSVHQSPCLLDFTDVILDVTHECECGSEHNVPSIHRSPLAKSDGVHQS